MSEGVIISKKYTIRIKNCEMPRYYPPPTVPSAVETMQQNCNSTDGIEIRFELSKDNSDTVDIVSRNCVLFFLRKHIEIDV